MTIRKYFRARNSQKRSNIFIFTNLNIKFAESARGGLMGMHAFLVRANYANVTCAFDSDALLSRRLRIIIKLEL